MAGPEERTLTRKGQATRERILEAATELVARHGVAGVSTDQVRRAAGIGGSQLYHYFDSKQALIRAVITRQADRAVEGEPSLGALDSLEALDAWADAAVERTAEQLGRPGDCSLTTLAGELGGVGDADAEARAAVSGGFLRWQGVLRDGLIAMRSRGVLRPEADVEELSIALLAALQGGALMSQTLGTPTPMRAVLDAAVARVRSFAAPAA